MNGCTAATATDKTGESAVTITFANYAYSPPCVKVSTGTTVTFSGSFSAHPLAGGDAPPTVDKSSPITETKTGSSAAFEFPNAGTFGFFCEYHYSSFGMEGAIFVE